MNTNDANPSEPITLVQPEPQPEPEPQTEPQFQPEPQTKPETNAFPNFGNNYQDYPDMDANNKFTPAGFENNNLENALEEDEHNAFELKGKKNFFF
jgi:hypothetical protein